jgi:hypothetical protein
MNDGNCTDKAMPCLYNIFPLSGYRIPITEYRLLITIKHTCYEYET